MHHNVGCQLPINPAEEDEEAGVTTVASWLGYRKTVSFHLLGTAFPHNYIKDGENRCSAGWSKRHYVSQLSRTPLHSRRDRQLSRTVSSSPKNSDNTFISILTHILTTQTIRGSPLCPICRLLQASSWANNGHKLITEMFYSSHICLHDTWEDAAKQCQINLIKSSL